MRMGESALVRDQPPIRTTIFMGPPRNVKSGDESRVRIEERSASRAPWFWPSAPSTFRPRSEPEKAKSISVRVAPICDEDLLLEWRSVGAGPPEDDQLLAGVRAAACHPERTSARHDETDIVYQRSGPRLLQAGVIQSPSVNVQSTFQSPRLAVWYDARTLASGRACGPQFLQPANNHAALRGRRFQTAVESEHPLARYRYRKSATDCRSSHAESPTQGDASMSCSMPCQCHACHAIAQPLLLIDSLSPHSPHR